VQMPRYMPQELFDKLTVMLLMIESNAIKSQNVLRKLDDLIKHYTTRPYPDEDYALLKQDLRAAANHILELAKIALNQIRNDYSYEAKHLDDDDFLFLFIKELDSVMSSNSAEKRPFWRRIFGGTIFNFEKHPLVDRVKASQKNALLAIADVVCRVWSYRPTRRPGRPKAIASTSSPR
jgi:hypothetical protein